MEQVNIQVSETIEQVIIQISEADGPVNIHVNDGIFALKSELPSSLAQLAEDETHRVVTDSEIAAWNNMLANVLTNEDAIDALFLTAFISTWKTDNLRDPYLANGINNDKFLRGDFLYQDVVGISGYNQIRLPFASWGTYDCFVDWGDYSAISHITAYNQAEVLHTYSRAGTYTVKIAGTCIGWGFSDSRDNIKLINISRWGILNPTAPVGGQFSYCKYMTCTATDQLNLTGITVLHATFNQCWNFNGAIGNWDTSGIVYMKYVFSGAFSFNQDLSGWNFSNVAQNLTSFMVETNFSVENYDKLLISLSNQSLIPNKPMVMFIGCRYSTIGLAARVALIAPPVSWDISDSGCSDTLSISIMYYQFDSNDEAHMVVIDQNEKVVTSQCALASNDVRISINSSGVIKKPSIPFVWPLVIITAAFPGLAPVSINLSW